MMAALWCNMFHRSQHHPTYDKQEFTAASIGKVKPTQRGWKCDACSRRWSLR